MMAALSFALTFAGFVCVALSMAKHWRDLFGKAPPVAAPRLLRGLGWLLLAGSLAAFIGAEGVSIGIVQWTAFLTLAALTVALAIAYKNKWWRA